MKIDKVVTIIIHRLNDGYITIVFFSLDPRFDLQNNANSDTFPAKTEASYLQSIPTFSKLFWACRLVALQDFHFA